MDFSGFISPNVGAVGILVLVVLLILWGILLPRATVRSLLIAKDEQIALYKTAYERSMETIGIKDRQIGQLMEMAKTTTHVIEAIPHAITPEGGNHHAALDQASVREDR
jgi:uncharacterized oligopeptide transporter (OPT) family protein